MKLVVITDPEFIPDEAAIINALFRQGMTCLHVRKPDSKEAEFKALISEIEPDFLDKTAIHQHHRVAEACGIKRLHFTEQNRKATSPEQLERLVEKKYVLSTSIHDVNEITNLSPLFSYTFFGPVFDSISKKGLQTVLRENFILKKEFKKIPVIGLGGIDVENVYKTKKMNLDGVAVLGAIWQEPARAIEKLNALQQEILR